MDYALTTAALAAGAICIYAGYFLYEDEERAVQSRLEDTWLRFEELREQSNPTITSFIVALMGLADRVLDSALGKHLFSLQAFATLSSLGVACLWTFILFADFNGEDKIATLAISLAVFYSVLSVAPAIAPRLSSLVMALAYCLPFVFYLLSPLSIEFWAWALLFVTVWTGEVTSAIAYMGWIAFCRKLFRILECGITELQLIRIGIGLGGVSVASALFSWASWSGGLSESVDASEVGFLVRVTARWIIINGLYLKMTVWILALPFLLVCLLGITVTVLKPFRRYIESPISRLLYLMQRIGISNRNKCLVSLGMGMLAWAIARMPLR